MITEINMKIMKPPIMTRLAVLILLICSAGCVPNTYYSGSDDYVIGLRWYDRGNYQNAADYWRPLAEKGDVDAQYRYGWLLFLNQLEVDTSMDGLEWIKKAAQQGHAKALGLMGDLYYQSDKNKIFIVNNPVWAKDRKRALIYYKKGYKVATYSYDKKILLYSISEVEKELDGDTIKDVENEVNEWSPTYIIKPPRALW